MFFEEDIGSINECNYYCFLDYFGLIEDSFNFDSNLPLEKSLDLKEHKDYFRKIGKELFEELKSKKFKVVLTGPVYDDGRRLRCVESLPPKWYLDRYYENLVEGHYISSNTKRKKRLSYSIYRRSRVLKSLERLIEGKDFPSQKSILDKMNRELISEMVFDRSSPYFDEDLYWYYIIPPKYILD